MEIDDYIKKKMEDYDFILNFIESENTIDDQEKILKFVKEKRYKENRKELQLTLLFISRIIKNHNRNQYFFQKIRIFLSILRDSIKESFSNLEIIDIFKNNIVVLSIILEDEIISFENSVITYLRKKRDTNSLKYIYYFIPIIRKTMNQKKVQKIESKISKKFNTNIDEWLKNCKTGENDSYICYLIRNDLIIEFIIYINKNNISLSKIINSSVFETNDFLKKRKTNLIEYAAFFGSVQIFQYLRMNNVEMTASLWLYAIHGRSAEIIHFLEEDKIEPEDVSYFECLLESIKCHHNEIAHYIQDNLVKENDQKKVIECCFHYYNFQFLPYQFNDYQLIFQYCCKYNLYELVYIILNKKLIDFDKQITIYLSDDEQFDTTIYNYALRLAASNNNLAILNLLLNHKKVNLEIHLFRQLKKLKQIEIPRYIISIPDCCFCECTSLVQIKIPPSVTHIDKYAFYGCSSLIHIKMPSTITEINEKAFCKCRSLNKIKIPSLLTKIKNGVFCTCKSLTHVVIPSSVIHIDDFSFAECYSLKKITIPSSVKSIGQYSFYKCKMLHEINFETPSLITSISVCAFCFCISLVKIFIPSSVNEIEQSAFEGCSSLNEIIFQDESSIKTINGNAFDKCTSLKHFKVPSLLKSINLNVFNECSSLTEIIIPSSVTYIGNYSFKNCSSLKKIYISPSIKSIGSYAFYRCTSLTQISIPSSVKSIESYAFYLCSSMKHIIFETPCYLKEIKSYTFCGCSSLKDFIIPNLVSSIGSYAFDRCISLEVLSVPFSMRIINEYAFRECLSLKQIFISSFLIKIDKNVFLNCNSLKQITIPFYINARMIRIDESVKVTRIYFPYLYSIFGILFLYFLYVFCKYF